MGITKNAFVCLIFFVLYSIWSFYLYGLGSVGDFIVTPYDEFRYIEATDRLMVDLKAYGLIYTIENYYIYSQSVHFGHYFILSFVRYLFNDLMVFWSIYQNLIYCMGVYFFSKYLNIEYSFIKEVYTKYVSILVFLYPVFYYLNFSLMRDISIFAFLSICLYLYKTNRYPLLIVFVFVLATYRINMVLCLLLYILVDQLKGKSFISIFKNLTSSVFIVFLIDIVAFGFISRNLERIGLSDFSNLMNEILVLFFSPLPFSIDPSLPGYLIAWFKFSFVICIFLMSANIFILVYRKFSNFVPVLPIFIFIFLYVFIYSTEVGVGFRQAAVVLPFIYIPILFYMISIILYRYKLKRLGN